MELTFGASGCENELVYLLLANFRCVVMPKKNPKLRSCAGVKLPRVPRDVTTCLACGHEAECVIKDL